MTFQMKYGVPQGSCLGPLLFVIAIIERHLPDVHTSADDTQLYISFNADSSAEQSAAVEAMQSCIADIRVLWMLQDRLRLNDGKTKFIIIGTRQQLAKSTIDALQVGESVTTPASEVKDLRCWFDRHFKQAPTKITYARPHCSIHLTVGELESFLVWNVQKILVNPFVTSRLDYW